MNEVVAALPKSSLDYTRSSLTQSLAQRIGLFEDRNLFWSWYEPRNFGDWIGPYLFEAFTGHSPFYCGKRKQKSSRCLYTAGSILRHISVPGRVNVWGSGVISSEDVFAEPLSTLAVRGPRTRKRFLELGFACPEVYGDPAVLMPLFYQPKMKPKTHRVGLIPHFVETELYTSAFSDDVKVIDVCADVEKVIDDICSVEVTYSSSLHGLILSCAYGVPTIWMDSAKPIQGDKTKFHDYFESAGMSAMPIDAVVATTVTDIHKGADRAVLATHDGLKAHLLSNLPNGWAIAQ